MFFKTTKRYKFRSKLILAVLCLSLTGTQHSFGDDNIPIPTPNVRKEVPIKTPGKEKVEKPKVYQSACPAVLNGTVIAKVLPSISNGQCGERSPLEVEKIAGISFQSKVVLNCRMATSVAEWIEETKLAAKSILKDDLATIANSTSYDCRKRRGGKQVKYSEHSFANALDISGFKFKIQEAVSVLKDWNKDASGDDTTAEAINKAEFLSTTRDSACKHFTTVLSPETNAAHEDHFHFDLGCHGKNCTYKICE